MNFASAMTFTVWKTLSRVRCVCLGFWVITDRQVVTISEYNMGTKSHLNPQSHSKLPKVQYAEYILLIWSSNANKPPRHITIVSLHFTSHTIWPPEYESNQDGEQIRRINSRNRSKFNLNGFQLSWHIRVEWQNYYKFSNMKLICMYLLCWHGWFSW